MGHEINFNIFDGPRNVFLCSIFVILFFRLMWSEHKIPKLAIKEIQEREDMLIRSHPPIHSIEVRQFFMTNFIKLLLSDYKIYGIFCLRKLLSFLID